jgi:alkylhydroperoxidase/carboxymuconolactone decarboxylase family protein YurZ
VDCIGYHVQGAIKAGATREDVADTISVAVMMGGGPAYMYGVKALEAYDQLS